MIRWTGLAPWEFEFPSPGSLTSTFLNMLAKSPGAGGGLSSVVTGKMCQWCPTVPRRKRLGWWTERRSGRGRAREESRRSCSNASLGEVYVCVRRRRPRIHVPGTSPPIVDFVDFDLIDRIVGVSPCHAQARTGVVLLTQTYEQRTPPAVVQVGAPDSVRK